MGSAAAFASLGLVHPLAEVPWRGETGLVGRLIRVELRVVRELLANLGTLEIRMPDQPTSLERTAGLVRLLRDLCEWGLDAPAREFDPAGRGVYDQNRWAASRFGPHGKLIHPDRAEALSVPELLRELPVPAPAFDGTTCEADLQLEVGGADGLRAVSADLVERTKVAA